MRKQTSLRGMIFALVILSIGLTAIFLTKETTAQQQTKIEFGAVYDCAGGTKFKPVSCKGGGDWDFCDVFYINEYSPGGGTTVSMYRNRVKEMVSDARCKVTDRSGVTAQKDDADKTEKTEETKKNNENPDQDKKPDENASTNSKFKIGDRVLASPMSMKEDKWFQPCTITGEAPNGYKVRCDPQGSLSFMDYFVQSQYVRPWANATPAPKLPECSFDAPSTKVSKTAPASAQLFKRVIYDWFASDVKESGTTNPLKVGITFLEFQMGKSFVNRVYVDPGTGAQRLHDGAPAGAMIYPVKTKYIHCRAYRDSIQRQVVQENFACFKDKFGDWTCPTDSVRQILETNSIPIQK